MKLIGKALSPALPLNERLAAQLATAGRALLEAPAILSGKPAAGLGPVSSVQLGPSAWLTCLELVNEFLTSKARADRSDRYLRQLKVVLSSFANGRARMTIDQVRAPEVEKWIRTHDWAPRTAKG